MGSPLHRALLETRSDGRRAWKNGTTYTDYYIYDQWGNDPAERESAADYWAVNTWGPNGLVSRRIGSTSTFYTFDERGTVAERLDSTGSVLTAVTGDDYGLCNETNNPNDPFGLFGAQWGYFADAETGLYLLGQRYYDKNTGRFINQDPIGTAGGINVYSYAGNNPVCAVDPSGLDVYHLSTAQAKAVGMAIQEISLHQGALGVRYAGELQTLLSKGLIQVDNELKGKGLEGETRWGTIYIQPDRIPDPDGASCFKGKNRALMADHIRSEIILLSGYLVHENTHLNHQPPTHRWNHNEMEVDAWGEQVLYMDSVLRAGGLTGSQRDDILDALAGYRQTWQSYKH